MKMQLGRLPRDPDKRALEIQPIAGVVPPPPPSVDHLTGVPLEYDGNDDFGDCVVVSFRNHFYATWMALRPGEPVPPITRQDCLDFYWALCGTKVAPGPGLVTETALDYLVKNGLGGQKPLAWGRVRDDLMTIEQVNSEFVAGIYGVEIDTAQKYPAPVWDDIALSSQNKELGGHEVCGGGHGPVYVLAATWAYIVKMTKSFVGAKLGEHHVIIWQHVWDRLTYERQVQVAADYLTLTGRPFPITPTPPAPGGDDMVPITLVPTITVTLLASAAGPPATSLATINPNIRLFDLATSTLVMPSQYQYVISGQSVVGPGQVLPNWSNSVVEGMWLVTDGGKPRGLLAHDAQALPTIPVAASLSIHIPKGVRMIASFISAVHNAWVHRAPWVRVAIAYDAAALLGLAQSFSWTWPTSVTGAEIEARAFLVAALAVVVLVVRAKVVPPVVAWFLKWSGASQVPTASGKAMDWKAPAR